MYWSYGKWFESPSAKLSLRMNEESRFGHVERKDMDTSLSVQMPAFDIKAESYP